MLLTLINVLEAKIISVLEEQKQTQVQARRSCCRNTGLIIHIHTLLKHENKHTNVTLKGNNFKNTVLRKMLIIHLYSAFICSKQYCMIVVALPFFFMSNVWLLLHSFMETSYDAVVYSLYWQILCISASTTSIQEFLIDEPEWILYKT